MSSVPENASRALPRVRSDAPSRWQWIKNSAATFLLATTFFACLARVLLREKAKLTNDKIVLSLAHWQLEPGVTKGFDEMAKRYNEVRRARGDAEIEFRQMPIPEGAYGQWVTTQLMGGTAPDLIEIGFLPYDTLLRFHARYFTPVTREIFKPNPYNKGTDLEDRPWKETFVDGLGEGIPALQEYYDVGLSTFSCRMFYNRELLKTLTRKLVAQGKLDKELDAPPDNLREFLSLCDKLHELTDESGRPYLPIAGSPDRFGLINWLTISPLSAPVLTEVDDNCDGFANDTETFFAILRNRFRFDDPRLKKVMAITRAVTMRLQPGWNSVTRDEAVMLFVQQRSLFIGAGSWDGMTLIKQAAEAPKPFAVDITQFPMVYPSDPEWGELSWGRPYEKPATGFSFGMTKMSKHPEVVLDFMRFLTAQKHNQEFNEIIGWIPVVRGAEMSKFLQAFKPNLHGVLSGYSPVLGAHTETFMNQTNPNLWIGEDSNGKAFGVQEWCDRMNNRWLGEAFIDFEQRDEAYRDQLASKETVLATTRAKILLNSDPQMKKYLQQRYNGAFDPPVDAIRDIARSRQLLQDARAEARKQGRLK